MTVLEISHSDFWSCSLHEYYIYLLRYARKIKHEKFKEELQWDKVRLIICAIMAGYGKQVKPTDIIRLSFDREQKQTNVKDWIEQMRLRNGINST